MKYNPEIHHRHSIRLKEYDYSQAGAYFMTICTLNRECLLGDFVNGAMRLNEAGKFVADSWKWLAEQYDHVSLDAYVVMPNHLHGIIVITDGCRGGSRTGPTQIREPSAGYMTEAGSESMNGLFEVLEKDCPQMIKIAADSRASTGDGK